MKYLILVLLSISFTSYARDCEVGGISDSPQKLQCGFDKISVALSCNKGTYFLNSSRVLQAYHMDVEEGASPLVFESKDMQMTVVIESRNKITAELMREGRTFIGTCR